MPPPTMTTRCAMAVYSLNSRTISTHALTFSTGVSGRMPWPRLKMWPGPRAGALQQFMHAHRSSGKGAISTAGSRLPCTAER